MAQFIALARRNHDDFSPADFTPELLEAEAEQARRLYADGIFRRMWSRVDFAGAVVLIEAASLEAAVEAMQSLPLAEQGMLSIESVVPLMPYRGFGPRG
jgi:muconolactone delta-isomerase